MASSTLCKRPGIQHPMFCIEPEGHEGCHTYGPAPDDAEKISDRLEEVMRLLTTSCPNYMVGDFSVPRPTCCIFHAAAETVMDAQKTLRKVRR